MKIDTASHIMESEGPSLLSTRTPHKHSRTRRLGLTAALLVLLIVTSALSFPILFSAQPGLAGTTQTALVGQVAFTSSGQLDPASSRGLNDIVTLNLHDLSQPVSGKSDYAWLLPDTSEKATPPLLLGKLTLIGGKTHLVYVHPEHENLLALYSSFAVTEQGSNQVPLASPLDPKEQRAIGSIPNIPTPGDEQHYSLLDHMRHLLAKDPSLQQIGLQGGLDIWLYRNAGKILEWSSNARDSWASGQVNNLDQIHRQMIRVLDYLDGTSYVYNSGDLPPNSPLLVDPQAGRIGLLDVSQTQALSAYLPHIDTHLRGLINAPGHTQEQIQLAIKIDIALKQVSSQMQQVRQDAIKLVKMDDTQLKGNVAQALLNDMVTNATDAYTGQFDPKTGGTINGVVWVHDELQGLATLPVTAVTR